MIPLDSTRWTTLTHAYGPATDTPTLLARLREQRDRPIGARPAWNDVYDSLCHQYSLYPATYAALPHLLDIAETGTPYQRFEVLLLAGTCAVHGCVPRELPSDLEGALETFLARVRTWSLPTVLDRAYEETELNYALSAIAGLRFPDDPTARTVENLHEDDDEVSCICPECKKDVVVRMGDDGPHGLAIGARGHPIKDFEGPRIVDRSGYEARLERAEALVGDATDPSWPKAQTSDVLAYLATRLGDERLATRLLDLTAQVKCPCCDAEWAVLRAAVP